MHEQWRNRILGLWAHLVGLRPGWVLAIASVLAVAAIVVTVLRLEFQPNRNDLISRDIEWNQRFIRWHREFPTTSDLIIVVQRRPSVSRETVEQLVDAMAADLADADSVVRVVSRFDQSAFAPPTVRLKEMPEFERRLSEMREAHDLLQSGSPRALLDRATGGLEAAGRDGVTATLSGELTRQMNELTQLIAAFDAELRADDDTPLAERMPSDQPSHRYLIANDGAYYFIRITPGKQQGVLDEFGAAIATVRDVIERHRTDAATMPLPPRDATTREDDDADEHELDEHDLAIGLTGIAVIENDETEVAMADASRASAVAMLLILVLLIAAFHSWRVPLLAVTALLFGLAWSFGYLTLFVGHLQVISVVFTVILMGLGIDFGVHLAANFELVRHRHSRGLGGFIAAMRDSLETVGPGIITGAITTAAAFATTMFTDFRGVAEMGEIAAAGIILCLIAMLTVFPAMLRLAKRKRKHVRPMEHRIIHFFEERWVMPFVRHPRITLAVAGVVTAAALGMASQMRFDFDLFNLMPRDVPSLEWQRQLNQLDQPVYDAISIVDADEEGLETARTLTHQLRSLEVVQDVRGIGLLFPENEQEKLKRIRELRTTLQPALNEARAAGDANTQDANADDDAEFDAFAAALRDLHDRLEEQDVSTMLPALTRAFDRLKSQVADTVALLDDQNAATLRPRYAQLTREFTAWRAQTAERIAAALSDRPLTIDDFPADLLRPYISRNELGEPVKYALEILPALPDDVVSVLDPDFLPDFVNHIAEPRPGAKSAIDPHVTGPAPQFYRSGKLIKDAYQEAALWALLVVFVLLCIDFLTVGGGQRSEGPWLKRLMLTPVTGFADAFLSLVPVAVGFAVTFGVMWLLGMSINAANIIVLPLMFGIGVDAGVHVIHRYRQEPDRQPPGLTSGTGKGITITSFATMIGFGSLMLARHRGVANLGFVLTLGIGLTMLACWIVMPAWLELRRQRKATKAGESAAN